MSNESRTTGSGLVSPRLVSRLDRFIEIARPYKLYCMLVADAGSMALATILGLYLRLSSWNIFDLRTLQIYLISLALISPIYVVSGVYRTMNRSIGLRSILELARATLLYTIILIVLAFVLRPAGFPRTFAIIQPILFFFFAVGSRMAIRVLIMDVLRRQTVEGELKRIIVYGAGIAGQQLLQLLMREPHVVPVCFIDDNDQLHRQKINGLVVYRREKLGELIEKYKATDVLLAISSLSRSRRREILLELQKYPVAVETLPHMRHLVDGKLSINDLRKIKISDLLGRDSVAPDHQLMESTSADKTVLVTGAGGSIGSELCRQLLALRPKRLILVEVSEFALYSILNELSDVAAAKGWDTKLIPELCDVVNDASIERLFARYSPQTVYHAAAYKHVPLVEANMLAGLRNNIIGTLTCATQAKAHGVSNFILVSTDKAVRPTNIMGASKRVCELILQALADRESDTTFAMVRFGNVLGSSGSVVPRFEAQIKNGGPITLTDRRVTRYFMTIPEAAQLVIQAGAMARGGEVYVLDMGESIQILDLARSMIKLSGLSERTLQNPHGDIEIREVGLRPGEKLYEELLIGNDPKPTSHPRIMTAKESRLSWEELQELLLRLQEAVDQGERDVAFRIVKTLVPEFEPSTH